MSAIENLLSRLDKVRRTGPGRWVACCPAHEDKSPSLAVRETEDGRVLLHCFSGCDVPSIVAAVGLELSDLFPPRDLGHHCPPERRPFPASDILRALGFESLVIASIGKSIATKRDVSEGDFERLVIAIGRIQAALSTAGVSS
jgi:hypothetical protein